VPASLPANSLQELVALAKASPGRLSYASNGSGSMVHLSLEMIMQAKLPALDFGGIRGEEKRRYIAAIQAAMTRDYAPIARIFRAVIARTLRSQR